MCVVVATPLSHKEATKQAKLEKQLRAPLDLRRRKRRSSLAVS